MGIRIVTFEARSGFTHVAARQIAQSPTVTFVTNSGPAGWPAEPLGKFQIIDNLLGGSSSTDGSRLRGTKRVDIGPCAQNDVSAGTLFAFFGYWTGVFARVATVNLLEKVPVQAAREFWMQTIDIR